MCEIKDQAHHSIMVMTGARTRECCPKCDSDEYYCNLVFDRADVHCSDGHVIEGYTDYSHDSWQCDGCGYCSG